MNQNIFARQLSNFIQDKTISPPTGFITKLFTPEEICLTMLSPREQTQLNKYQLNKRRCEWFSGRFAGKKAVQKYIHAQENTPISLAEIEILNREDGRPYLNRPEHISIDISISHSRDYAVGLVSESPCGIDIQRSEKTLTRVAERFCSAEEEKILLRDKAPLISQLTKLWAAKEALQKAVTVSKNMPGFLEIQLQATEKKDDGEIFHLHCKGGTISYHALVQQFDNYALACCLLDSQHNKGDLCQSSPK